MSYLIAIPCFTIVYWMVGRLDLARSTFVLFALLLSVGFASLQWFVPGVDVLIASCLTMALANLCAWFIDTYATPDETDNDRNQIAGGHNVPAASKSVRRFCSQLTHDYAVSPGDAVFAIGLINSGDWQALSVRLAGMNRAERQGFYANLNYSSVSERALQEIINKHPNDADAHVLMGHVKLCLAKRLGLTPGAKLDEPIALSIRQAFKHFNLALRITPNDTEALCGLLIAKGFTGLSAGHVLASLQQLLAQDPRHLHGVIAAARFLVLSTAQANEFISAVEGAVDGRAEETVAISRIIVHIECIGMVASRVPTGVSDSQVIADLYKQMRCYQRENETLGSWQRGIADNVIAYMLQVIDDKEELKLYLEKIDGSVSPYPWQINTVA